MRMGWEADGHLHADQHPQGPLGLAFASWGFSCHLPPLFQPRLRAVGAPPCPRPLQCLPQPASVSNLPLRRLCPLVPPPPCPAHPQPRPCPEDRTLVARTWIKKQNVSHPQSPRTPTTEASSVLTSYAADQFSLAFYSVRRNIRRGLPRVWLLPPHVKL